MTAILLAVAVSASFWAGYLRRRAAYRAQAMKAQSDAVFDLGLRVVGDRIVVRLSYEKPIRLGGFAISPTGSVSLEGADLDVLEGLIRRARAEARR
jgi:hypothetical protein